MLTLKERTRRRTNDRRQLLFATFALFVFCLCAAPRANADVVTEWNAITLSTSTAAGNGPQQQARAAAAEVLTQVFGEHAAFSTTGSLPGVTRSFQSFWDAAREVVDARVFAGIHFRRTCVVSNEIGRKIGKYAMKNYLKPLR